ncbi:hypothetical protein HPB50_014994 [Hyalomma asiaticum]|uniref:Uncharacterized protein n=1 Tax=Hyalomma asiaticum TaxID=266040 RepID=A0ACB7SR18_HYAAI|nr:hypothetical protein HPB50_014994 [Hyalomma asiaticum]
MKPTVGRRVAARHKTKHNVPSESSGATGAADDLTPREEAAFPRPCALDTVKPAEKGETRCLQWKRCCRYSCGGYVYVLYHSLAHPFRLQFRLPKPATTVGGMMVHCALVYRHQTHLPRSVL